ncbi:MAG: 3-deoxy-manno-octulosonate cytidylyltransferase [candidate division WOR-3 bacterium]
MKIVIAIPARIGSTRFPRKILAPILGKPMIQWVFEGASQSKLATDIVVATDSEEIQEVVRGFGGTAIMTPSELQSGTDRVYYAIKDMGYDLIVNLQGDEPLIRGDILDSVISELLITDADIVTPYKTSRNTEEIFDENRVKIVADNKNYALYFSRSVIPFDRERTGRVMYKIHIGIYGFKKESLARFVSLKNSKLEKIEKLEQLRALEFGMRIKLVEVDYDSVPVDVPEDILKVEEKLKRSF